MSEVNANGQGIVWLGSKEGNDLTAITYTNKAAILLRGKLLDAWCSGGQRTIRDPRTISIKAMNYVLTATYLPVWMGNNEAEIEEAKDKLSQHINLAIKDEIPIIGGDFNAHIGENEDRGGTSGKFGLRNSNRQGLELLSFCEENNLCYVNSFSNHKRRGTWFNPALRRWYELDGFMMRNEHRHNLVRKTSVIGEISLSDHRPVKLKLELIEPKKRYHSDRETQRIPRINFEKLRDPDTAIRYKDRVELKMEERDRNEPRRQDDLTEWNEIASIVTSAAEEICGRQEKQIENPWMLGHEAEVQTLRNRINGAITARNQLMEEERIAEIADRPRILIELNQRREDLKTARTELQVKTRIWEKEWWDKLIDECKEAGEIGNTGIVYRRLRELGVRGMKKAPESTTLTKEDFKNQFQKISKDRFENDPEEMEATVDMIEDISETDAAKICAEQFDEIPSREEIITQMKKMRDSAPGQDGVRLSYLMSAGQEITEKLVNMVQYMFQNGAEKWEESLKVGLVIPLFKKGDRNNANNFRGVVLLAMGSRIVARIAADRIRIWAEEMKLLDDDQSGFRKGRSTADVTQMMFKIQEDTTDLIKRARASGIEIDEGELPAARLLDLKKAYPRVNKPMLWKILRKYGIGERLLRVIMDLHETTKYMVKSREGLSEAWTNERGLREGCPSSPPLFNIFHQASMRIAAKARKRKAEETGLEVGISYRWVPGSAFPNVSRWETSLNSEAKRVRIDKGLFADDTTITGKKKELEQGVNEIKRVMNTFEERNNDDKEEHLDFGKEDSGKIRMLGCYMKEEDDTKQRIKRAGLAWVKVKSRLKGSKLNKKMQARVIEAVVESTLLFDCQTRTWQVLEIKKLQSTMDKMYRYTWSNKTKPPLIQMQEEGRNMQDVRNELGVKSVRSKLEGRVLQRIGHIMRMDDDRAVKAVVLGWLEDLEEYDKVPGKKRKTILYWKKILKEAGIDWTMIGAETYDRTIWKATVKERVRNIQEWESLAGHNSQGERGERNVQQPDEEDLTCTYDDCGKICKSKAGLISHRKRIHEKSSRKMKFTCNDCNQTFDTKGTLKNHRKCCTRIVNNNPNMRTCDTCNRQITKTGFRRHKRSCAPGEEIVIRNAGPRGPCPICALPYSLANMARHIKNKHE